MDFHDGFVSEEQRELCRSAAESVDPGSVPALEVTSPRSPRSPRTPRSPRSKRSSPKGSPVKHLRHSNSGRDGSPKKGGTGGKGTRGKILDNDGGDLLDHNDPNYHMTEENFPETPKESSDFLKFRQRVSVIVEEYFATGDIVSTANELNELGMPSLHYYFVKKLVSLAMDRHDKEKEMAAVLLSSLYAETIEPQQVYRGFSKLVESTDDLLVDIPDAIDILALFIARAVVDDILPPIFLAKQMSVLPSDSKRVEVVRRADKGYLSTPLHTEVILRKWGGSRSVTAEEVKAKINDLLIEYVTSGDKVEACRCIKQLRVPFFHHDIVKRALVLCMEQRAVESRILDLLKLCSEEGLINASQITQGFNRLIDAIDDLSLDIPCARKILQSLVCKAASEGWLCASSLKSLDCGSPKTVEEEKVKLFKMRTMSIIQEYFLTGDILEVTNSLEAENPSSDPLLNAIFIKRLITLAMERKNREKEMASLLLSSLCFPADDVASGFLLLIESAEDAALDIPSIVDYLAMFLARAVVDEVLAPFHLKEIESLCGGTNLIGSKVVQLVHSLLSARLSSERVLRCWGGGGNKTGWEIDDVKDKIWKLLEEYDSGGELLEARRCIKELGMPFFHHEIVKKALIIMIEKKNDRLWSLLQECYLIGLITPNQMTKGFERVRDCLDDLVLDVPHVEKLFVSYVEKAKIEGWLEPSFSTSRLGHPDENGLASQKA